MPDLTYETFYHCETAERFETQVLGEKDVYTVTFGETPAGPYEYDWECDCPAFRFRKDRSTYCKHIIKVKTSGEYCGWRQIVDGGGVNKKLNGDTVCPKCGRTAIAARHAV